MDYKAFYGDVLTWIGQANQAAVSHGMESVEFWTWVTSSSSDICAKYQDHRLVIKQMLMMAEWLEEICEEVKSH